MVRSFVIKLVHPPGISGKEGGAQTLSRIKITVKGQMDLIVGLTAV